MTTKSKKTSGKTSGKKATKKTVPGLDIDAAVDAEKASKPSAGKKGKAKKAPEAKPEKAPAARDPRLPPAETVLTKTNRAGKKVECTVCETGAIDYKGVLYKSLSGAAVAAAKDLGISGSQNGFLFWGVIRQSAAVKDPVDALTKAWARYEQTLEAVKGILADKGTKAPPAAIAAKLEALIKGQAAIMKSCSEALS
jgi:hypothetical protein